MTYLKKSLIIVSGMIVLFSAGFVMGEVMARRSPDFNGIRVNHTIDYTGLVDPYHPYVKALAKELGSHEEAYLYVRDQINFEQWRPTSRPGAVIRDRAASCLGKAVLLCSLYRAMDIPSEDVFVVTGNVSSEQGDVEHAWVNLKHDGQNLQQDPTSLLGVFGFSDFPEKKYTQSFIRKESFCFNDYGFAVVSQLNRARD